MPTLLPAQPRNPLRTYQFRVGIVDPAGGTTAYVAGVRSVSGLRAQVSAYETWEGGNNLHRYANPNKVTWEPITLEQGLALDNTLELWSEAVLEFVMTGVPATGTFPGGAASAVATGTTPTTRAVKRDVVIDAWDEWEFPADPETRATTASPSSVPLTQIPRTTPRASIDLNRRRRYRIRNAWISKYQAIPKLDSMTSEVALLSVELFHEGWVREDLP